MPVAAHLRVQAGTQEACSAGQRQQAPGIGGHIDFQGAAAECNNILRGCRIVCQVSPCQPLPAHISDVIETHSCMPEVIHLLQLFLE